MSLPQNITTTTNKWIWEVFFCGYFHIYLPNQYSFSTPPLVIFIHIVFVVLKDLPSLPPSTMYQYFFKFSPVSLLLITRCFAHQNQTKPEIMDVLKSSQFLWKNYISYILPAQCLLQKLKINGFFPFMKE